MITFFTRIRFLTKYLVLFLPLFTLSGYSQNPATFTGIVTNCNTGNPIIGAKITAGTLVTYSVFGGIFSLSINPPGTYNVTCTKAGFDVFSNNGVVFNPGAVFNFPICLNEFANPPAFVNALLDTTVTPHRVDISWQNPRGDYELLYDDGIQDDFTAWSVQGNMNAVKFTPLAYPATVTGGKINIGTAANYQAGSTPFVPFQVDVYDASGPGGAPGVKIAGPVDVLPVNFGWNEFSIPGGPVINSGNFYLVMIQGGNAPNAAGLAVDETNNQFRSYARFVTGGSFPWIPGAGNFMIRASVNGPGGPGALESPEAVTGYAVSRLRQGEEQNPSIWFPVGTVTNDLIYDNAWPSLPCGPYRWAAKALYQGNRVSAFSFSNVIGKCWTVNTTVHVTLSCDSNTMSGVTISLKNLVYPDTLYVSPSNPAGLAFFPNFWKGTYELKVTRFGYVDYVKDYSISTDTNLYVFLLQSKIPPSGLEVNDSSLMAHWSKPVGSVELLNEKWQSGSFTTNGWTVQGHNWSVSSAIGNPMPSAMFSWSPAATNYTEYLVSKPIVGQHSDVLRLKYDIFLNNYGTTSLNQMAVEVWDGTIWHMLRNYDNANGDVPWTSQNLDISSYSGITFKVRFRAYGIDSYDINNWNIDNIIVEARESSAVAGECVLGYNVYLQNVLCGFTPDTVYPILPSLVSYGNTYTACVDAVYGSGPSVQVCYPFTSSYLPPPIDLQGSSVADVVTLTWGKPASKMKSNTSVKTNPPGLVGYIIFRNGTKIDSVADTNTYIYHDTGLYPGTYAYKVASVYDLTSYGHPGKFTESYPDGPVQVNVSYGMSLPFDESWDHGNFNANSWTFDENSDNWSVNTTMGNPSPCAQFSYNPHITNYSSSLISPVLSASSLNCANIFLNFDCRLLDNQANGNEKMNIGIYYNNVWHEIDQYSNLGTTAWINHHLDITPVKGKAFRIRFRASGLNSQNIVSWSIDNIHVYGVCKPPAHLFADSSGNNIRLTWSSPVCEDGFPLQEGFEETFFPPVNWTQIITNTDYTWEHASANSPAGVHSGLYAAGLKTAYTHQDEWLIAHNIEVTGDLEFWSFAFQGSVHADHYYVKISEDQGTHWETLLDMSALPAYPSSTGYNEWVTPYVLSLASHLGQVIDIAWQAVDGDNQGLWHEWIIDDCSVGSKMIFQTNNKMTTAAYSVYRQTNGYGNYNLISQNPVQDTTYLDMQLWPSIYRYYVTAFNGDCSVSTSSDTVLINLITGISSRSSQFLNVFPNPAHELVTVRSSTAINSIEVFNYLGQRVFLNSEENELEENIDVSNFQQGVYFFRIKTKTTLRTFKISVVR